MRQVLQSLRTGETEVLDVPCPQVQPGHLLVRSHVSLISAGTERMLLKFGKAGWLGKARQQPERLGQVLDKIKSDGLLSTIDAVRNKLEQPLALGYSNVGTVVEVGQQVTGFRVGDRVVSNGFHAEVVCVPRNLCAKIPEGVSDDTAAFAVVGAIALQSLRLAEPTLGESFVVSGLGLVGLMAVQLLRANGCRVLGLDMNPARLALARAFGAAVVDLGSCVDPIAAARAFSRGDGVDGVLVAAAARGNAALRQAAGMSRKRGRIVLTGVVGMTLPREEFYKKELKFQVSCSYGPGRYDPLYEQGGQDYPLPYVRWTEQRNFAAVLDMMSEQKIRVTPLISHRFPIAQATNAYAATEDSRSSLGVLLDYPSAGGTQNPSLCRSTVRLRSRTRQPVATSSAVVGFLGAGNFARRILIPAFQRCGARLHCVATKSGASSVHAARRFGFAQATSDVQQVLADPDVNIVVIATRHDTHAEYVCRALELGKHVFVEKPLAIKRSQLEQIIATYRSVNRDGRGPALMVGFNRRFAPHVQKIATLLHQLSAPKSLIMTVNAGAVPFDSWLHDPDIGGRRLIGEGCHFIDLLRYLVGSSVVGITATMIGEHSQVAVRSDKVSFTLQFADGSFGTVHYLANGHRAFPKERLEVFCSGRTMQLDNFRSLRTFGWPGVGVRKLWRQDKGHRAEVAAFLQAVGSGQPSPIAFSDLVETTRVSFDVSLAVDSGMPIRCEAASDQSLAKHDHAA